jgi:hypothetical protein
LSSDLAWLNAYLARTERAAGPSGRTRWHENVGDLRTRKCFVVRRRDARRYRAGGHPISRSSTLAGWAHAKLLLSARGNGTYPAGYPIGKAVTTANRRGEAVPLPFA